MGNFSTSQLLNTKLLPSLLTAAFLVCASATGASYRFDMGGKYTPLTEGYLLVTPNTGVNRDGVETRHSGQDAAVLSADEDAKNPNYGWKLTVQQPRGFPQVLYRNDALNPYYANEKSKEFSLYSDGVLSFEENTFEFKAEPGRYAVTAVIGDLMPNEGRPGNSIWANGAKVVENISTDGNVKAITFPVQAGEGKISLRFRADSDQKYVTVMVVNAEPLAEGQECMLKEVTYPASVPTTDTYKQNWKRFESVYSAEWDKVKAELKAEGVDFEYWSKISAQLKKQKNYCEYFPVFRSGVTSWERISQYAEGISIAQTSKVFSEMGIDGITGPDAVGMRELPINGIKYAIYSGGQAFSYTMKHSDFTPDLLKMADGTTTTIDGVLSSSDPKLIAAFRKSMHDKFANVAEKASFMFIDEPVEPYCASGKYGDFSKPAEESFKRWASEHGWKELAQKGFPERGRTMDFYRFYQFRLELPAMFVRDFIKDTPVEKITIVPGNGNLGPEMMNHSGFWPPSFAKHGLAPTTWAYDSTASCKMYSEVTRLAEEYGVRSCVTPPYGVYTHNTPLSVVPLTTACISARHWKVMPFGPVELPGLAAWMKPVYYGSRLAHATSDLTHTPPLYVWCPESIVFNDLVELKGDDANNWKRLWNTLFKANIDYAVTELLKIPKDAILLYTSVNPVLTDEEFTRLQKFVKGGGKVLVAMGKSPEYPDGKAIDGWKALPAESIISTKLSAPELKEKLTALQKVRNWDTGVEAVKTYRYQRGGRTVHLLNNTNIRETAKVTMPSKMQDVMTGKVLEKDSTCEILPGLYALLEEI